jgi:trimeric autotransporter adhesin
MHRSSKRIQQEKGLPRLKRRPRPASAAERSPPTRWAQQQPKPQRAKASNAAAAAPKAAIARRETARELAARSSSGGRAHLAKAFAGAWERQDGERAAERVRVRRRAAAERAVAAAASAEVAALRETISAQRQTLRRAADEAEVADYALELAERRAAREHDGEARARANGATAARGILIFGALATRFGFGGPQDAVARVEELERAAAEHAAEREAQASLVRTLQRTVARLQAEAGVERAVAAAAVAAATAADTAEAVGGAGASARADDRYSGDGEGEEGGSEAASVGRDAAASAGTQHAGKISSKPLNRLQDGEKSSDFFADMQRNLRAKMMKQQQARGSGGGGASGGGGSGCASSTGSVRGQESFARPLALRSRANDGSKAGAALSRLMGL